MTVALVAILPVTAYAVPVQAQSVCGLPSSTMKSLNMPATGAGTMRMSLMCGAQAKVADASLVAADEDVVFNFPVDGVSPDRMRLAIEEINDSPKPLSEAIKDVVDQSAVFNPYPLYAEANEHNTDPAQVVFDGTVQVTASGGLVIVIPSSEVQASWWSWADIWKAAVATAAGLAAGAVAYTLCYTAAGAVSEGLLAVLCPSVMSFFTGFVGWVVYAKLKGKEMDETVFVQGLAVAFMSAAFTVWWELGLMTFLKEIFPALLKKLGQKIAGWATTFAGWLGDTGSAVCNWVRRKFGEWSEAVWPKIREVARKAGLKVDPDPAARLMPLGDSITYGVGSSDNTGYRDELWTHLTDSGRSANFVGTQQAGSFADPDHEGHPGWRIDTIMTDAADCAVPSYRPNVVTLHAGTNDINQDFDLARAPSRLVRLIDQILGDAPEATVLLATLVPATKDGMQPKIDAFNAQLPGIVDQYQAQGKHVLLVDMSAVTTADLAQPAHPGDSGYRKMGDAFYVGLLRADGRGWLKAPVAGTGQVCVTGDQPDDSKAGPGWNPLGVIAVGGTIVDGSGTPVSRTDIADFDGDDRGDYAVVYQDGSVQIARNTVGEPGQPVWVPYRDIPSMVNEGTGDKVRFADLNGDGRDDYLVLWNTGAVSAWYNLPDRMTSAGIVAPGVSGATGAAIRFADVDGDGRDDYLRVGDDGSVHAYINTYVNDGAGGSIHWVERLNWAPGVSYGSRSKLRLADVNGDRKADYLMVGSTGAVHAYINNGGGGAGGFTPYLNFVNETGYPGDKSTFRDISGDGKADYVVIYDGGSVRAWLNRGGNIG